MRFGRGMGGVSGVGGSRNGCVRGDLRTVIQPLRGIVKTGDRWSLALLARQTCQPIGELV